MPKKFKLNLMPPSYIDDVVTRCKTVSTRSFRENLVEVIAATSRNRTRIVLTKNGEPRVAIVSLNDLERLAMLDEDVPTRDLVDAKIGVRTQEIAKAK